MTKEKEPFAQGPQNEKDRSNKSMSHEVPKSVSPEFFRDLYGNCLRWFVITSFKNGKPAANHWFQSSEFVKAAEVCNKLRSTADTYFGLGLRRDRLENGKRGSIEDVVAIPGLWIDIDHIDGVHAETALLASNEVIQFVRSVFPIPPTIIVDSGGGLHLYWLFDRPWLLSLGG